MVRPKEGRVDYYLFPSGALLDATQLNTFEEFDLAYRVVGEGLSHDLAFIDKGAALKAAEERSPAMVYSVRSIPS